MLVLDEIVSTDFFAAREDGTIDWFTERDGVVDAVGHAELIHDVSAVLLGRRTYEEFSAWWPSRDPALTVNALPKHVVSETLDAAPWGDLPAATVERGGPVAAARRVQGQYDGHVVVWGSLSVARELLRGGLVDELWTRVVPVLLGGGQSFVPAGELEVVLLESSATTARYAVSGQGVREQGR